MHIRTASLSSIVLDLMMKLRTNTIKDTIQDPLKSIPIRVIRSLLDRSNIERAEVRLFAVECRGELKKVIKANNSIKRNSQNYRFRMLFGPSIQTGSRQIEIGDIVFYVNRVLNKEEINFIQILVFSISDYIGNRLLAMSTNRVNKNIARIRNYFNTPFLRGKGKMDVLRYDEEDLVEHSYTYEYDANRIEAGSIIARTIRQIEIALKPHAVYYSTVLNDSIFIEYYHSRHKSDKKNLLDRGELYPLKKDFLQSLWAHNVNETEQLLELPKAEYSFNHADWQYLLASIKVQKHLVGLIIVQYKKKKISYFQPHIELLTETCKYLIEYSQYLYQRRTNSMVVNPIFKSRDTKVEDKTAFVLMPFTTDWSDRIWKKMIRPTIEGLGLKALRADDLYGQDIMEDVWENIVKSHVIIADITGRNPNVFYELGIAHTLGKRFILLTQDINDIPFDLNRYRCIVYQDNYDGYELLTKRLKAAIQDLH